MEIVATKFEMSDLKREIGYGMSTQYPIELTAFSLVLKTHTSYRILCISILLGPYTKPLDWKKET